MFEYKCMHVFAKIRYTPILNDFVAHYDTLNNPCH